MHPILMAALAAFAKRPATPEQTRLALTIVGSMTAFAVFVILKVFMADRRRDREMPQGAMDAGLFYEGDTRPFNESEAIGKARLFTQVMPKRFAHVMRGSGAGADTVIFDYTYAFGLRNNRNRNLITQTVAAFRLSGKQFPIFELAPENIAAMVETRMLGMPDYDFPDHPVFSKRFALRGPDEGAVRSLFKPEVIGFFESWENKRRSKIEGSGDWLLVYSQGIKVEPADLRPFLDDASTAVNALQGSRSGFGW